MVDKWTFFYSIAKLETVSSYVNYFIKPSQQTIQANSQCWCFLFFSSYTSFTLCVNMNVFHGTQWACFLFTFFHSNEHSWKILFKRPRDWHNSWLKLTKSTNTERFSRSLIPELNQEKNYVVSTSAKSLSCRKHKNTCFHRVRAAS